MTSSRQEGKAWYSQCNSQCVKTWQQCKTKFRTELGRVQQNHSVILPSTSTYTYRANLMREPDNFKMKGIVCYNTSSDRTHNVHLYTETHMYAGTFVLINEDGTPFCYATVTPHVGSPYGNEKDRKWNQFNPLNYPCYAEITDRLARPNQTFFYACFSVKVAKGKFHMRVLPRDDKAVVIPIIFQKMGGFGKTSYVQYKDT